jgi:hypothetical protein
MVEEMNLLIHHDITNPYFKQICRVRLKDLSKVTASQSSTKWPKAAKDN